MGDLTGQTQYVLSTIRSNPEFVKALVRLFSTPQGIAAATQIRIIMAGAKTESTRTLAEIIELSIRKYHTIQVLNNRDPQE